MTESRRLLQHFLAGLAYRTQKALRGAPDGFADFRAGTNVRTPYELLWHMTGVIGYARTMLRGGDFAPPRLATLDEEIARFHATLVTPVVARGLNRRMPGGAFGDSDAPRAPLPSVRCRCR